jgi:hypothetical protein
MGLLNALGAWIQRALFTSSFPDIVESLNGVRQRVEELDSKLSREVANLEQQIRDAEARLSSRHKDE